MNFPLCQNDFNTTKGKSTVATVQKQTREKHLSSASLFSSRHHKSARLKLCSGAPACVGGSFLKRRCSSVHIASGEVHGTDVHASSEDEDEGAAKCKMRH